MSIHGDFSFKNSVQSGLKMSMSQEVEKTNGIVPLLHNFQPNLKSLQKAIRHRIGSATKGELRCQSAKVRY